MRPAPRPLESSHSFFIHPGGGSEGAALCHSTRRSLPGRKIAAGPGPEPSLRYGRTQRAHQLQVEVQVVERVQAATQDLVAAVEVAQVGARVVAARIAGTIGIDRPEVGLVGAVADVDDPGRGEQMAVAGVAGSPYARSDITAAPGSPPAG